MRLLTVLRMRFRALVQGDAVDRDLAVEMREHFDRLVAEQIARGQSPVEAEEAARREFGPMAQLVDQARDARGVSWIANALQDMNYGIRLMVRAPGFSAAAMLTV